MRVPSGRVVWFSAILFALVLASSGCIAPASTSGPAGANAPVPPGANVTREDHDGRLVCGVGLPEGTTNPCAVVEGSKNVFWFAAPAGVLTLVVAVEWVPRTDLGRELVAHLETKGFSSLDQRGHRFDSASGGSPLILRMDAGAVDDPDHDLASIESVWDMQVRVFPAEGMPPNVVVDQAFHVTILQFSGEHAPADLDPSAST